MPWHDEQKKDAAQPKAESADSSAAGKTIDVGDIDEIFNIFKR